MMTTLFRGDQGSPGRDHHAEVNVQTSSITVTNVFGEARTAMVYVGAYDGRDGYACPFCASVTVRDDREVWAPWPRCSNPGCTANTLPDDARADSVRRALIDAAHKAALREDQHRTWERNQQFAREYMAERQQAEREWWASARLQAEQRGACLACFTRRSRYEAPYFVRHRKACPIGG
jgi:hypothetical protein